MNGSAPYVFCLAALLLPSCGGGELSPQDRVKTVITEAEDAVEAKDLAAVKKLIAENYRDDGGNDRRALLGIMQYHFLRNEALHLLVRIDSVDFTESGEARVAAIAAMAGEPIPTAESLGSLRADIYRFDVVLADGGDGLYRLRSARWRRAAAKDLL